MAKKITLKNKNGDTLCPHTAIEQVQGLKEALDGKLPLTGGTLTGNIKAPAFRTTLTSGESEAVMAYPVNISWSNDLNSDTYLKAGMYRTSSATSTVNQPNEKGHSNLLTIRGNESDNIAQMFFDYWNNGKVFTRVGSIADTTSTSHIFNRDWKQLRTMDDLVTTSHIAGAAITPAKIQTNIALNGTPSMTVEPTTSSPDKTIASVGLVKEVVEDINTEISNAETRSKSHAEDYTDAEITKIENGETVAQKANSLYDEDSGTYKNWGEIDSAITEKIGDQFENYATKSYVQEQISNQVAVPIASETEDGKVKLATPEDVTAVEADGSAVNDSAKAVTPYTLKEYIASKDFATTSDISDALASAKPVIFFQAAQPAGGKDGDIWIIP